MGRTRPQLRRRGHRHHGLRGPGVTGKAVANDDQQRIIVAGGASAAEFTYEHVAVARYNPDGSLDTSFGDGGTVTVELYNEDEANAVTVDAQGRIVVAGNVRESASDPEYFAVARLLPDGSLDDSFGEQGTTVIDPFAGTDYWISTAEINDIAVDDADNIVVAGRAFGFECDIECAPGEGFFAVSRLHPDGELDPSFDDDGTALVGIGECSGCAEEAGMSAGARALALDAGGHIVVAGRAPQRSPEGELRYDFGVIRLLPDGSLDPSFDGDGKVTTEMGTDGSAWSVAIDAADRIVAAGAASNHHNGDSDFAAARYLSDGSLDTTFSHDGVALTSFGYGSIDRSPAVVMDSGDSIVVAGTTAPDSDSDAAFALLRYLAGPPADE